MTQIVLMLYEDPQADKSSDKRFHLELHFSPGVKCSLDKTPKDPRNNLLPKPQGKKDDDEGGMETNVNSKKTFEDDTFRDGHGELKAPGVGNRMRSGSHEGLLRVSQESSSGETDQISVIPRRCGNRSLSECDEPVKLRDMLGKSGKDNRSEGKYKAMSKSLGKTN